MSTEFVPNPGSDEAVSRGCNCPVIDNGFGRGHYIDHAGRAWFIFTLDCPLHSGGGWVDQNKSQPHNV